MSQRKNTVYKARNWKKANESITVLEKKDVSTKRHIAKDG